MKTFSCILVANRGEIALRILRAARELGIRTVAVYSEADRGAAYLQLADSTVCIGPAPSAGSYLDIARIISAAEISGADAIHPGYGFLAENAEFAEICERCHLTLIGPRADNIRLLGDKARARALAAENGIPLLAGTSSVADEDDALRLAAEIGFPVMIKAAAGGGGRGMRVGRDPGVFTQNFQSACVEAEKAFGSPEVYVERYLENPRHIEIQILADHYGHVVHLGERDCSLQRRHQKLIEESPSPVMTAELRQKVGGYACRLAEAAGYRNAGTVEFLFDPRTGDVFFMEVNTRIQVEHPVTEEVCGLDLVKEQIRLAAGDLLGFAQHDVVLRGCAIEVRINAEDPFNDFKPNPGVIQRLILPGGVGVRVDTHVHGGYAIPSHYDSMIAKLIVHRPTRQEAIATMRRALAEFTVEGVKTTIPLIREIMAHPNYVKGQVDTGFIQEYFMP